MNTKQTYITALRNCSTEWVLKSYQNPNKFMTKVHLVLHKIVLRERGALK
jgi:hypothetical protein